MPAGLYAKLIVLAAVVLLLAGAGFYLHHAGAVSGAARVQAQWDAAKAVQAIQASKASEVARKTETGQSAAFAGISSTYLQATAHDFPTVADPLAAGLAAGTVRLRDRCPAAPASGGVSDATARSRAADAAATAALGQRTADAIAAVRIADAADRREAGFRAQIVALRALLTAERQP
jgi:hypothetical protein